MSASLNASNNEEIGIASDPSGSIQISPDMHQPGKPPFPDYFDWGFAVECAVPRGHPGVGKIAVMRESVAKCVATAIGETRRKPRGGSPSQTVASISCQGYSLGKLTIPPQDELPNFRVIGEHCAALAISPIDPSSQEALRLSRPVRSLI